MWNGKQFSIGCRFFVPKSDDGTDSEFKKIVRIFENAGLDVEVIENVHELLPEAGPPGGKPHKWTDADLKILLDMSQSDKMVASKTGASNTAVPIKRATELIGLQKYCAVRGIQTPRADDICDYVVQRRGSK